MRKTDIIIRPLVEADVNGLLRLCQDALDLDVFHADALRRHIFGDPHHREAFALVAQSAHELIGCAIGVVHEYDGEPSGRIKLWAVHPTRQGEGLGGNLLSMLEERFASAEARRVITQGAPHFFLPGVDVRYTRANCILQKRGYDSGGWTQNMDVILDDVDLDTSRAKAALRHEGYTFERARPQDRTELTTLAEQHFNSIWPRELETSLKMDPIPTFVARHASRIVAFAAYDVVCLRGWFGPMGTLPDHRGKGLGEILLKRCLAEMRSRGDRRCEICWVGPVEFYARTVGARVSRVFRTPIRPLAKSTAHGKCR